MDKAASYGSSMYVEEVVTSSVTTSSSTSPGAIDKQYIQGIPGILKLLEAIFSLVAFICVVVGILCTRTTVIAPLFNFVAMLAFVFALVMWLIGLLKLRQRVFKCDCINWPLCDLVSYGVIVALFFICDIILAVQACWASHTAGVAFGFLAFFAFAVDFGFIVRTFIAARKATTSSRSTTVTESATRY